MSDLNLKALCDELIQLSTEVGDFIQGEISKVRHQDIVSKSLNSLVSYVDKTAEQRIISRLEVLVPEAGYIAEEGSSTKVGEVYNWIIDPLDGTTNFLHGLPVYSISIALQKGDELVLGLVYEINQKEHFYAWQGSAAYLNGVEIKVSKTDKLADCLLATGFPYYDFKQIDPYFELLKYFAQNTRGVRRMGSAAVDLAYVACGRFDAFFEYSLHPWDVAAGAFIVKQAGGKISDFSGKDKWLHGKEIIASSSTMAEEIQAKVSGKL